MTLQRERAAQVYSFQSTSSLGVGALRIGVSAVSCGESLVMCEQSFGLVYLLKNFGFLPCLKERREKRKKTKNEKHESEVTLKWATPKPHLTSTETQKSNFHKRNRHFYNRNFWTIFFLVLASARTTYEKKKSEKTEK